VYDHSARAYDLIIEARGKDYEGEATRVRDVIRQRRAAARSLLDVACGTGGHLEYLRRDFEVEGVDASAAMLALARQKLGAITLHCADMRTFHLTRRFDAVTCLFSSIGYLVPATELARGVANMAAHLVAGGILIVEPWVHPEDWRDGNLDASAAKGEDLVAARVVRSTRSDNVTTLDMHWALALQSNLETFTERHVAGLYTIQEYEDAFRAAGLDVDRDDVGLVGRGLFIGTKTTQP